MSKKNKELFPELRFPEYKKEPPFKETKLSKLLFETKQRNRDLKFSKDDVLSVSGDHGCVNQIELLGRSYAGVSVKDYHIAETNDIVYTKSPLKKNPYGIIKENKGSAGIVSTLYAVYRATDICHPSFLDHYFSRDFNLNSYLQPLVNKGAKNDMKVKNSDVLKGTIYVPGLEEQIKLANFLSSIDKLIVLHTQKLDALKDHKKGLMQQLFPAEGEAVPKLRFPEFNGIWKLTNIDKVFSIFQGFAFSSKDATREGVRWLKIADVGIQHMDPSSPSYLPESFKAEHDRFTVKAGDYVVALTRPILGGKLKISKVDTLYHGALLNQRVGKIVTDNNSDFIFCMLQNDSIIRNIEKNIAGNDPPNLSSQQIAPIPVRLPSLQEQEKIANCFISLDAEVVALTKKIELLKNHKSGLMQKLFPVMDGAV